LCNALKRLTEITYSDFHNCLLLVLGGLVVMDVIEVVHEHSVGRQIGMLEEAVER
jgi:hypothetical protein